MCEQHSFLAFRLFFGFSIFKTLKLVKTFSLEKHMMFGSVFMWWVPAQLLTTNGVFATSGIKSPVIPVVPERNANSSNICSALGVTHQTLIESYYEVASLLRAKHERWT